MQNISLEQKYFTNKRIIYESKYLEDCLYNCLDTPGKQISQFFDIIVQNSRNSSLEQALKLYKKRKFQRNFVRYKI